MDAISEMCAKSTGSSNTWEHGKDRYFFERSNVEHDDGAITGSVWRLFNHDDGTRRCRKAGAFRIDGEGRLVRFPTMPTDVRMNYTLKGRKTYLDRHGNPGGDR